MEKMYFSILIAIAVFNAVKANTDGHCDFESGLCGYTYSDNNDGMFTWDRITSGTPSHGTGPFSAANGDKRAHYLYTEASSPAQVGDTAMLTSPEIKSDQSQCLSFYYNAHGEGMGTLKVEILQNGQKQELFQSTGNKGVRWHHISETVKQTGRYKVVFTSIRGPAATSDMAIDDISLSAGECTNVGDITTSTKPKLEEVEPKPYKPMKIYGAQRIGCYKDQGHRAFPERKSMQYSRDPITFNDRVRECRDIVDSKGEDYVDFGIENYGSHCFYGSQNNDRTKPFAYGPAENCALETVGTINSIYVYQSCKDEESCEAIAPSTTTTTTIATLRPATQLSEIKGVKQIGCYKRTMLQEYMEIENGKNTRYLNQEPTELLRYVSECLKYVKEQGFKYFGLNNSKCLILRGYEDFSKLKKVQCQNKMTGNWWSTIMVYEYIQ